MSLTKVSYSLITGAPVNVLDFGAAGDGVQDDTAAVQSAINHAQSQTQDGVVYFPAGKYRLTSSLAVGEAKNLQLVGEGGLFTGSTLFADFNGAIFYSDVAQTWSARNLVFTGDPVDNGTYGVKIDTTAGSAQVYMTFTNCTFNDLAYGVYLSNAFTCRFENCEFATISARGVEIAGGSGCSFVSTVVEMCNGYGMLLDGIGHTLTGCYFENNAINQGGTRDLVISGDSHVINGGVIAPNPAYTIAPILVYGNTVTFNGMKGYDLSVGAPSWIEVNGTFANVLLNGTGLTASGNLSNVIQILPGVPASFDSEIKVSNRSLVKGACNAWAQFDGTPTGSYPLNLTTRGDFNCSVVKNGTGDYTVTFDTAFPNTNFSIGGTAASATGVVSTTSVIIAPYDVAAGAVKFRTQNGAGSPIDVNFVSIQFFGL